MYKIYSRHRIKVPNFFIRFGEKFKQKKNRKILKIIIILIIAFSTLKVILDAIMPIFEVLCKDKAKSIATIVSNEQATNVMAEHSYDEIFTIEKDHNGNITMIKSNIIAINEIISDVAIKIQEELNKKGREDISIPLRKFYRI